MPRRDFELASLSALSFAAIIATSCSSDDDDGMTDTTDSTNTANSGDVNITNTQEACEAAAQPDVTRPTPIIASSAFWTMCMDECRGISDETRGYRYHAASPGENMFIGCFTGKTVASEGGPGGPGGPPPQ